LKIKTLWQLVKENFEDPINQILVVAAIVSTVIGVIKDGADGLIEGFSIVVALIIITVVNSANNYASEVKLRDLMMISDVYEVAVYRNGPNPQTIDTKKLVVGDVYLVEAGNAVPADSIFLEGKDVECDESTLNGEPDHIPKTPGATMFC
jgi:Ca2+ transporting ATPase